MKRIVVLLAILGLFAVHCSAQATKEYFAQAFKTKCSVCQLALTGVKARLSSAQDFNKVLLQECEKLPIGADICKAKLVGYETELSSKLSFSSPSSLCHQIHWCAINDNYFTLSDDVAVPNDLPQDSSDSILLDLRCSSCMGIFTFLYNRLGNKLSTADLITRLSTICATAPYIFKETCDKVVAANVTRIAAIFDSKNPATMCEALNICNAPRKRTISGDVEDLATDEDVDVEDNEDTDFDEDVQDAIDEDGDVEDVDVEDEDEDIEDEDVEDDDKDIEDDDEDKDIEDEDVEDEDIEDEDIEDEDIEDEAIEDEDIEEEDIEDEDIEDEDIEDEDIDDEDVEDVDSEDFDEESDETDKDIDSDDGFDANTGKVVVDFADLSFDDSRKRTLDPLHEDPRVFYFGLEGQAKSKTFERPVFMPDSTVQNAQCQICQWAVSAIEAYISQPDTEQELARVLQELCTVLPGNYASICQNFVVVYMDEAVNYVIDNLTPPLVCSKIDLCVAGPAQAPAPTPTA